MERGRLNLESVQERRGSDAWNCYRAIFYSSSQSCHGWHTVQLDFVPFNAKPVQDLHEWIMFDWSLWEG